MNNSPGILKPWPSPIKFQKTCGTETSLCDDTRNHTNASCDEILQAASQTICSNGRNEQYSGCDDKYQLKTLVSPFKSTPPNTGEELLTELTAVNED